MNGLPLRCDEALVGRYLKLVANEGLGPMQFPSALFLASEESGEPQQSVADQYSKLAADQVFALVRFKSDLCLRINW
jgi:hypothetical protein